MSETLEQLRQSDQHHVIHPLHHPQDHQHPLIMVEGRGAIIKDAEGREYIDGLAGLWNVAAGHGRVELAQAASEQMARLAFASNYAGLSNIPSIRLAERLVQLAYQNISGVYFTTSGAESNESAFKIARYYWKVRGRPGKVKIISRIHAYHGVTMAAMSATGMAAYHRMFGPLVPEFIQVAPPYPYRWPGGDAGVGAADALEQAILREGPDTVAAFIAEPVMGAGGVIVPPATYFPRVREICDRHDVLLITDEVITGFGRTGRWFALGHWGVQPDLTSFAKAVTSAYLPLGGVLVSQRVHAALLEAPPDKKFMHAATYSGHPVCCAVGVRNLEILQTEGLVDRAGPMGRRLLQGLETLRDFSVVGDVRGLGMMCGVELVQDRATKAPALGLGGRVVREALSRGLLARIRPGSADPPIGDTICLAPPLMTPEETLDRIPEILRAAIKAAVA
ncbi:MAG TPA: aspartate aminotransferase family protein [bacterium]|nr:aspartate aminotransferase family protein [bacterium]